MEKLRLLPKETYIYEPETDPLQYYYWPILGGMYRRRVELAINECMGGERVLEVGFGSGITFQNLHEKYQEIHGVDLYADVSRVSKMWDEHGIETKLRIGNVTSLEYADNFFDTVLLISILEHVQPEEQAIVFKEIKRVLKPGGQVVFGVPVERPIMVFAFKLLGHNIREHHFSTEEDVRMNAEKVLTKIKLVNMNSMIPFLGTVYQVGHYVKSK
jgi:2-polyprenyl-3-methyl-5-hydroxy-6-metoxy-1,4-benzoquinol methylase